MFFITRKQHEKSIDELEKKWDFITERIKRKYDNDLNHYKILAKVCSDKLETSEHENADLLINIENLKEIIKKMQSNKKASDTMKRKNQNERRREKRALKKERQESAKKISDLIQENEKLETERIYFSTLVAKLQEEISLLKRKPTLEQLKFEKANKVDKSKLVDSRKTS